MKKIILCLGIAAICAGCKYRDEYFTTWIVKNATNQTIKLSPPPFYPYTLSNVLSPGAEREIYYREGFGDSPAFDVLLVNWPGWAEENIVFEILSSDGTSLKQWRCSDKNYSGKQFFNVSSWKSSHYNGNSDDPRSGWTFEILPEDIK